MIFIQLFYTFFTIGLFSFGGGYAMLPLIQNEVVSRHDWIQIHSLRILLPFLRLRRGRLQLIQQRTSDIRQQTVSGEPSAQRSAFLCRL